MRDYALNWHALPTLLSAGVLLVLGWLVLVRERASLVSVLFFLLTLTMSIWFLAFSGMYLATDARTALWWAKAAYLGVPFIPAALYHFTAVTLRAADRYRTRIAFSWTLSALFVLASVSSDLLIQGVYRYWWGYYPRYGPLGAPFIVFFFALMLASLVHYWNAYQTAGSSFQKKRIRWLMLALLGAYLAGGDFLAKYGWPLYPFGYAAVVTWLVFLERAIWQYHFVDITPAFAAGSIVRAMPHPLLVLDHEGVVHVANDAACRLLRHSQEELVGTSLRRVAPGLLWQEEPDRGPGAPVVRYETPWTTADERPLVLDVSVAPVQSRSGQTLGMVWLAQDVTERRRAENALRERERELRAALDERETLSHDLHDNIIQSMYALGMSLEECQYLIKEDPAAVAKKLGQALTDLNTMIQDVRGYIDGGTRMIVASQLREELARLLRTMRAAEAMAFRLELAPAAARTLTAREATELFYIVKEAMSNSVRHSGGAHGTVSIHRTAEGVCLRVKDDGRGFDVERAERAGKGLASMRARVERLGGRLQIHSTRGGTEVVALIPTPSRPPMMQEDRED
ncbi:ATP-binding protein [Candidatus Nitrospira bockiana]